MVDNPHPSAELDENKRNIFGLNQLEYTYRYVFGLDPRTKTGKLTRLCATTNPVFTPGGKHFTSVTR